MQLTTWEVGIITTLILAVSPIEPIFYYNRIIQPAMYWIQPIPSVYYPPDYRMHPVYNPSYFRGLWYTFPYLAQPDHRPPLYPHYARENLEDSQALERLAKLKETTQSHPERVIVSSIGKLPHPIGFSDKSLLGFFNNFSLRFVSRMSSLPSLRLSYKNITLTGIAIG